jgi:hypothetical protein
MKLSKMNYGYRCRSDHRLQFHERGRGWEVRLNGRQGRHYFKTLTEATAWARQHWRPYFLQPVLDRLREAGLGLWQTARQGDEASFLILLDWLDDYLPTTFPVADRSWTLREARAIGLFRPRARRATAG